MKVFATLINVLALTALGWAAAVPEDIFDLENEVEQGVGLVFDGENSEMDFFVNDAEVLTTEQKLEAMGIDSRSIHPSILEDAQLLVVSFCISYIIYLTKQ